MQPGDFVLRLQFTQVSRPLLRCVQCAGEAPPPDLPAIVVQQPALEPLPFTRFSAAAVSQGVAALGRKVKARRPDAAFDYKQAQAGERQPGEEG
jgi:hypothetical protein